jgi:hypothetical protein
LEGFAVGNLKNVQNNNDTNFENARKALIQSYDSRTIGHEALIVALIVGALTLVSRWDVFYDSLGLRLVFYVVMSALFGLSLYVVAKTLVWAYSANAALGVLASDVEKWLNELMKSNEKRAVDLRKRCLLWRLHNFVFELPERNLKSKTGIYDDSKLSRGSQLYLLILTENRNFSIVTISVGFLISLGVLLFLEGIFFVFFAVLLLGVGILIAFAKVCPLL